MQVILLEKVANVGNLGDIAKVKDGYARNFLLPQGKALRANEANKTKFEGQRAQLEARNLERKSEAQAVAEKLDWVRKLTADRDRTMRFGIRLHVIARDTSEAA